MKFIYKIFKIVILLTDCASQKLLLAARRSLGEILSAFEFMDHHCIDLVLA
jgi:hypothetical protein